MKKEKKAPVYLYVGSLLFLGVVLAWLSLSINQQFPVQLHLASMLSPAGAQVSISGARIKHWLVGVVLSILAVGVYMMNSKKTVFKDVGTVMFGVGFTLVFDEYEDVIHFMATGTYP